LRYRADAFSGSIFSGAQRRLSVAFASVLLNAKGFQNHLEEEALLFLQAGVLFSLDTQLSNRIHRDDNVIYVRVPVHNDRANFLFSVSSNPPRLREHMGATKRNATLGKDCCLTAS